MMPDKRDGLVPSPTCEMFDVGWRAVTGGWLIFRWDGKRGEATGVYLDNHSYR
jgi:hypothetical protein